MKIRPYRPDDVAALAALYRDAVEGLGAAAYGPEQIAVWAAFADEHGAFRARLSEGFALVVEMDGAPAAFCHLHPLDHISLLYTATRFARQGLATAVYRGVEAYARDHGQVRLHTDASKISRPFFAREGFEVVQVEEVERLGVTFERYRMEKELTDGV